MSERKEHMKKLIGTLLPGLILVVFTQGQQTEVRYGASGIPGIPPQSAVGDTISISFYLVNTGQQAFNDTIQIWSAVRDSSGGVSLTTLMLIDERVDSIGLGDSIFIQTILPLDATYLVPRVNITVVWPILYVDDTYTTEAKAVSLNMDSTS